MYNAAGKSPETAIAEMNIQRGILVRMAKDGQLHSVRCEMPTCYCPGGRSKFAQRTSPMTEWALNADHYPTLKMDGGKLSPGNIRLAHVRCNRDDFSWRKRIREMLEKRMSLEAIADVLNAKGVRAPHGTNRWTPAQVRKAYVS